MLVEIGRPGLPRQTAPDARGGRGTTLGGPAPDLHLPELRVRDQGAVDEDARADPGPKGQEDDDAGLVLTDPEPHLGDPCGIGVVDDEYRALERAGQPIHDGEVDPRLVDVAGELEHAADGDPGQADPDRRRLSQPARLGEPPDQPRDRRDDGVRRRWDRGRHAQPLRKEASRVDVDDGRLDPAAADIDADGDPADGRFGRLLGHRCLRCWLRSS